MNIYLYKKTHNKTGLQYLGKTTNTDPHKYPGSGIRWTRHLNKHGYDYTTEILFETTSKEELKEKGLYYSELWNIVDSDDWANLRVENGDGGSDKGVKRSEHWLEALRNKPWSEKQKASRLENCLKSAAKRKGKKNPEQGKRVFANYVNKNKDIFNDIWQLFDAGKNRRQISIALGISWDRANVAINKRSEISIQLNTV
jgi:hypothetical protein